MPMFEPGKVSFMQDGLCWRGADVMGDRPGSLKLGSFRLLDVGGREPGCPGRGCILSDAALCSNVDCSKTTKWSTPITKSLDLTVVTTLQVGFPGESLGPTTGGFACLSGARCVDNGGVRVRIVPVKITGILHE